MLKGRKILKRREILKLLSQLESKTPEKSQDQTMEYLCLI